MKTWSMVQHTISLATEVAISPQFLNISPKIRELERILDYQEGNYSSSTLNFLVLCNNSQSKIDYSTTGNNSKQISTSSQSHEGDLFDFVSKDPSKCSEVFQKMKKDIQLSCAQIHHDLLTEITYAKYLSNVEDIFANSSRNLSSHENFTKCEDHKDQMIYLDKLYYKTAQVGKNMAESLTYEEAYHHSGLLFVLFEEINPFRNREKELFKEFQGSCNWLKYLGNEYRIKSHKIMKRYNKLKEVKDRALLKFGFLRESWLMMQLNIYKIELSIEIIKKYQQNELTKLKLWETIQNSDLQHSVQKFTFYANKSEASMHEYCSEIKVLKEGIKTILDDILALKLPTFKTNNLPWLEVVKSHFRWIKMENDTDLLRLWAAIFIVLEDYGSMVREEIVHATDIPTKVNVLTETLRKYKDSLRIYKDFLVYVFFMNCVCSGYKCVPMSIS